MKQAFNKYYSPGLAPNIRSSNSNYLLPLWRNDLHLLGGGFPGEDDLSLLLSYLQRPLSSDRPALHLLSGGVPSGGNLSLRCQCCGPEWREALGPPPQPDRPSLIRPMLRLPWWTIFHYRCQYCLSKPEPSQQHNANAGQGSETMN